MPYKYWLKELNIIAHKAFSSWRGHSWLTLELYRKNHTPEEVLRYIATGKLKFGKQEY